jgi:hypothetical protein
VAYGRRRARTATIHTRWQRLGGAAALVTGSLALMATSEPERCSKWSPPTAFKVEGDCGSGGVIVIEADSFSGQLTITNQDALLASSATGQGGVSERYSGINCPYTLDQGSWGITVGYCSTPAFAAPLPSDGGIVSDASASDAGSPSSQECPAGYRQCQATLQSDGLWFSCTGGNPGTVLCRSRLTVLP